jgi:hypothetical protein
MTEVKHSTVVRDFIPVEIHFPRSITLLCCVFGGYKYYVWLLVFTDVRISELAWPFLFYVGFIQANFHVLNWLG